MEVDTVLKRFYRSYRYIVLIVDLVVSQKDLASIVGLVNYYSFL